MEQCQGRTIADTSSSRHSEDLSLLPAAKLKITEVLAVFSFGAQAAEQSKQTLRKIAKTDETKYVRL